MTRTSSSPEIAIIGGGIGGLASAAFLHRAGIDAHVFERAEAFSEVGAGIVLAPNAVRLLIRLGLRDSLIRTGVRLEAAWEFRRWADGNVLSSTPMGDVCEARYGEATWTLHRADLVEMLKGAIPEASLHLGSEAVDVANDDEGATVTFLDGSTVRAGCVIAADGIHSALRNRLVQPTPPRFSGICAWRALVPRDLAPEYSHRPVHTLWLGPDKHLVHYPVCDGRLINIVAATGAETGQLDSWETAGRPEALRAEFAGWDEQLVRLLSAVDQVGRWAIFDRDPIDEWVVGRTALLGDAAHPMLAFFAQGAAQAMEDGAALAVCLSETPNDIQAALARYQQVRVQRANGLLEASRDRQHHHHLPDGPEQEARDRSFREQDPLTVSAGVSSYDAEAAARIQLQPQR